MRIKLFLIVGITLLFSSVALSANYQYKKNPDGSIDITTIDTTTSKETISIRRLRRLRIRLEDLKVEALKEYNDKIAKLDADIKAVDDKITGALAVGIPDETAE